MCTFQILDCPACDGEGMIYFGHPNDPSPRGVSCTECGGEGCIVADIQCCTDVDLDMLDEDGALLGDPVERENDNGECKL